MVKSYSRSPAVPAKSCSTKGSDLRVHFKNTFEVAAAIRGMPLKKAKGFLEDVIEQKQIVPFRRYHGGVGRHAQAKQWGCTQGRWPEKSCKVVLDLLRNLEASADSKGLDVENMSLWHVQVNRAQKGRRKTFRAHGGIKPYLSSNCHIEIIATENQESVPKAALKA
ncbi:unnamed protein product [Blepharisma stoltei]|uniref:60S ribosomal protein L17 n=1 Tax=Blepharisma stoltei TaxID=1481888 RepID=A0AAU9JTA9_9CILI|nr:unnamed protein product [Blepharisma stoltei]CAG9328761.1 unnamed protein product [Blepharisma stoltei]|mmetsp:Transcript_15261/g.15249  ORF Transcript_15261/g.15249 Transcript_15261/m.15249 type:complete len:166 (+) Transcript_15261:668-1165(+)